MFLHFGEQRNYLKIVFEIFPLRSLACPKENIETSEDLFNVERERELTYLLIN